MIGPGKYDHLLTRAREEAKASAAILVIFDGEKGHGFSCQLMPHMLFDVPRILREIAREIEESHAKGVM
jgi:hypothetical protein